MAIDVAHIAIETFLTSSLTLVIVWANIIPTVMLIPWGTHVLVTQYASLSIYTAV
jgi:hypothetical protein